MNIKSIVNSKGELQESQVKINLEGAGGAKGKQAVIKLTNLINSLKEAETKHDILIRYYVICGYAICCNESGFLTEKSLNELMEMVEYLVEKELARACADSNTDQE